MSVTNTPVWLKPIAELIDQNNHSGVFYIGLPQYRPDLAKMIAYELGYDFFDYRCEVLSALGWQANSVTLDEMGAELELGALNNGLVAFNVEALLAAKPAKLRGDWLEQFSEVYQGRPLLIPLFIYSDLVEGTSRYYGYSEEELPEQGFINRILN